MVLRLMFSSETIERFITIAKDHGTQLVITALIIDRYFRLSVHFLCNNLVVLAT